MMEINLGTLSGSWSTSICFSPDALSYMRLNNANAVIPKKYTKDARARFFLQEYSNQINKNKKEQLDGINMKAYTKLDVDDYAFYSDNAMWVHGRSFNAPTFNFPNRVHVVRFEDNPWFTGKVGYSDLAYNFTYAFYNCKRMNAVFGYPEAGHAGNGDISITYRPFRNHYNFANELKDYDVNYRKEYGTEEFPGYNCQRMFAYTNAVTSPALNFANIPEHTTVEEPSIFPRMNFLHYTKAHKIGGDMWELVPAINDAIGMFEYCTSGFASLYSGYSGGVPWNFDIYVNYGNYMFHNARLNANYFNIACMNGYSYMFYNTNFTQPIIDSITIYQDMSYLEHMFESSNIHNVVHNIHINALATNSTAYMFNNCRKLQTHIDIPTLLPSQEGRLANTSHMFDNCVQFDQQINIPTCINNAAHMFRNCHYLNHVSEVNSGIVDGFAMYMDCPNLVNVCFNAAIGDALAGVLFNAAYMFRNCVNLTAISNAIEGTYDPSTGKFTPGDSLNLDPIHAGLRIPSSINNKCYMFDQCRNLSTNIYLSKTFFTWESCIYMFRNCRKLQIKDFIINGRPCSDTLPFVGQHSVIGSPLKNCQHLNTIFYYAGSAGGICTGNGIWGNLIGDGKPHEYDFSTTIYAYVPPETWLNHDFHNHANMEMITTYVSGPVWTIDPETGEDVPPTYGTPWVRNTGGEGTAHYTETIVPVPAIPPEYQDWIGG